MGTSADDVPALFTFARVVQTMGSVADTLPHGMVRTCWGVLAMEATMQETVVTDTSATSRTTGF
jgi:hypothetical protein